MIKITFKWGEVAPAYLAACLHSHHRKLVHDLSSASSDMGRVQCLTPAYGKAPFVAGKSASAASP